MKLTLRPAGPPDTEWLESLRRAAYQDLFEATWGGWDEARHRRHFATSLERAHISLIVADGERIGMIQVFEAEHEVEIGELQVLPSFQNRGIGRRVLLDVIRSAQEKGQIVLLSLGLKNEGAYRLYSSLGFKEIDRSDTHIHMAFAGSALPA